MTAKKDMSEAERDRIMQHVRDPFIIKYLRSLGVHFATLPVTQIVSVIVATVVLITDPWLSPIADLADHVLTVDVEAPSPYDSMVPSVALVEALVAGVVAKLGKTTRSRISNLERLREGYTWDDQALSISGEDD